MSKLTDFLGGIGGGSGIGGMPIQIVSSDTLLSPNYSYGIDTSQGGVEVTLPASPIPGDRISFFDAALAWGQHPAIIRVNGNVVEQENVELDSYSLSKKAGVQELLFINDLVGWKDTSLYKTGVDPMWYGSFLHENYRAEEYVSGRIEADLIYSTSSSKNFVIPSSGYYCFVVSGGSGTGFDDRVSANNPGASGNGGSTIVQDTSGKVYITAKGGLRNSKSFQSAEYLREAVIPVDYLTDHMSFCPENPVFLLTRIKANTVSDLILDGALFGIDHKKTNGGKVYGSGSTYYQGNGVIDSSVVYYLSEGEELNLHVGARGGVSVGDISKQSPGISGSVKIYQLKGL